MVNDIVLTGVGPNAPPNVYGQINFAQGQGSLGNSTYAVLILANMGGLGTASTGTLYGPDTAVTLQQAQDSINLFGDGYPAARMYQQFIAVNKSNRVYVMPVPSASGTAASATLTVTLSAATQTAGVIVTTIGTTQVQATFGSSDTVSVIATSIVNSINSNTGLGVAATSLAGVITISSKVPGARGNWLRWGAQVVSGAGPLLNGSLYSGRAFFTGGAGSDDAGYTTCINNLIAGGLRFYKVITEAGGDSVDATTNGIAVNVQTNLIDFEAQPLIGKRQCLFMGSVDTLSHTTTVALSLNDPRCEIITCKNLDVVPGELTSQWVAAKALFETPFLGANGVNFDNFGATTVTQGFWSVPAPLDGSSPSSTDIQTAVVSGITILKVVTGGLTKVVKSCTTHFWTGVSTQFDPRIVDMGKVTICDYFLDDLINTLNNVYQNKLIGNDPVNGVPGPGITTPSQVAQTVTGVINTYASAGLINGPSTLAGLVVQRGQNPTSRIEIQVPLFTADLLHSFTVLINQVQ